MYCSVYSLLLFKIILYITEEATEKQTIIDLVHIVNTGDEHCSMSARRAVVGNCHRHFQIPMIEVQCKQHRRPLPLRESQIP